jgi:poly(3-hydroxybutyrate) depolymerase
LALLTVEAEADALVGRGQTHGLHARLLPGGPRAAFTLAGAAHHELFTGPRFRKQLAPRLVAFADRLRGG